MKRKIISLCLALALVVCMALPAFAAVYQGSYYYNGTNYTYDVSTSYTSTKGTAYMVLHNNNTLLLAVYARGTVNIGLSNYTSYANKSGYGSVTANLGNQVIKDGILQTGTVIGCNADFYILDTCVKSL